MHNCDKNKQTHILIILYHVVQNVNPTKDAIYERWIAVLCCCGLTKGPGCGVCVCVEARQSVGSVSSE